MEKEILFKISYKQKKIIKINNKIIKRRKIKIND